MRARAALVVWIVAAGCAAERLPEGRWTGEVTPANHPDRPSPIAYDIRYEGGALRIAIVGPDGGLLPAHDVRLAPDTLYFGFNEPEADVPLQCALAGAPASGFDGRCADAAGKWARFTMTPP
ncbi:MAG: hypothetical protein R2834_11490 [Rhodothermales bacterium]